MASPVGPSWSPRPSASTWRTQASTPAMPRSCSPRNRSTSQPSARRAKSPRRWPRVRARAASDSLANALKLAFGKITEPLACCLRAVKRTRIAPGDTALVVGLGSIGCLLVQLLTLAGASAVLADDVLPARRALGLDGLEFRGVERVAARGEPRRDLGVADHARRKRHLECQQIAAHSRVEHVACIGQHLDRRRGLFKIAGRQAPARAELHRQVHLDVENGRQARRRRKTRQFIVNWDEFAGFNQAKKNGAHISGYIGHDEPATLFVGGEVGDGVDLGKRSALRARKLEGELGYNRLTQFSLSFEGTPGAAPQALPDHGERELIAALEAMPGPDGFTVAAYEDEDELASLCETYEAADAEGRRLIRLLAELSSRNAIV